MPPFWYDQHGGCWPGAGLWNAGADPTIADLHWSTGLGGRLQFSKSTIFGLDLGRNDEGFGFAVGTSFAF